jgi:thymidylate synthase
MNQLDIDYQNLLKDILENGVSKNDRTGTGTLSVFGKQIRHNMKEGFPLLTTKKMAFKSMVTELLWFLRGDTNIKFLVDKDCNIWNGDAYQGYLKRINGGLEPASKERFIEMIKNNEESRVDANGWKIGELGPIYGKQWRDWNGKYEVKLTNERDENGYLKFEKTHIKGIDQIVNLISELKTNPDSRRLMVNAWNVGELHQMVLPPCHYGFQIYTRELDETERVKLMDKHLGLTESDALPQYYTVAELKKNNIPTRAISLMWNQRSVDTGLGLSFNIASYALLLMMIAKQVNMIPDELIGNLGDVHLYSNHIEPIKEQLTRTPYSLPTVKLSDRIVNDISEYTLDDIVLENYQYHPTIKMSLSN